MKTVSVELSEHELSLLVGLVDRRCMEYQEKAETARRTGDQATLDLARDFGRLYEKLRLAAGRCAER